MYLIVIPQDTHLTELGAVLRALLQGHFLSFLLSFSSFPDMVSFFSFPLIIVLKIKNNNNLTAGLHDSVYFILNQVALM